MEVENLLYWLIVGILFGALLLLVANSLITNLIEVQANVIPT